MIIKEHKYIKLYNDEDKFNPKYSLSTAGYCNYYNKLSDIEKLNEPSLREILLKEFNFIPGGTFGIYAKSKDRLILFSEDDGYYAQIKVLNPVWILDVIEMFIKALKYFPSLRKKSYLE